MAATHETAHRAAAVLSLCVTAFALSSAPGAAQENSNLPRLYTNEQLIEDVTRPTTLDVGDLKAVLAYVLGQLPERVKVYPTENYYYFYFYEGGVRYSGNFRFDIDQRDKGLVEFIYFKDSTDWFDDDVDHHETLGEDDGVTVERVADLAYRVAYAGKAVTFELNDLSAVQPPKDVLGDDETFLGPVADESGLRFFLIFNETAKLFEYVLDETNEVGDQLIKVAKMDHVLVGERTGFAFLEDPNRGRKILVGVYESNVEVNDYLDGPFDQLPDNFLKSDELRRAILLADPTQDAPIDRLGIEPGGDFRVSVSPYVEYYELDELAPTRDCAAKRGAAVYECLKAVTASSE